MSRGSAAIASLLFLVLAPGTVAGLIPWEISRWRFQAAPLALRAAGAALILGGLYLLVECFGRFALQGRGTPAPIAPTERLVVDGPYRRVRNPMYAAVVAVILGQAALFADLRLLVYGVGVWAAFHLVVIAYEEPTLRRSFGRDYDAFTAVVPRWIPRLRPWRGD